MGLAEPDYGLVDLLGDLCHSGGSGLHPQSSFVGLVFCQHIQGDTEVSANNSRFY